MVEMAKGIVDRGNRTGGLTWLCSSANGLAAGDSHRTDTEGSEIGLSFNRWAFGLRVNHRGFMIGWSQNTEDGVESG